MRDYTVNATVTLTEDQINQSYETQISSLNKEIKSLESKLSRRGRTICKLRGGFLHHKTRGRFVRL